jgi:exopolysaccharide production protein ExoZ
VKIHFLQALRAIAAWLVVADHAVLDVTQGNVRNPATFVAWAMGSLGVYVFFVISGFIMTHICWTDFGQRGASAKFLRKRTIRIVPLYWLATLAAFAFHKVSATHGANDALPELVRSLLFIPYQNDGGGWSPILPQGWTLNYEMFFYAVFAAAIVLPRKAAIAAIAGGLTIFVIVGPLLPKGILTYLSSPVILFFVIGIGLAVLWRRYDWAEPKVVSRSARYLEIFGDASYSTYLVHGLALTLLLRLWMKAADAQTYWFVPAGLVAATVVGLGVYFFVETPIIQTATRLARSGKPSSLPPKSTNKLA